MEDQVKAAGYKCPGLCGTRLQQLIDGVVGNSLSIAERNGTRIRNEVGRGVVLRRVNEPFLLFLEEVIQAVISNARRGDIRISVRKDRQHLVLQITDRNNYNGYALSCRIGSLIPDAILLGGNLDIRNPRQLEATISFHLPDRMAA